MTKDNVEAVRSSPPRTLRSVFRSRRFLLTAWALASVLWGIAVAYDFYEKVQVQADMSRDVESELDASSCGQSHCNPVASSLKAKWSDIASTYLQFGSFDVLECVAGPPLGLMVAGFGTLVLARRFRAGKSQVRPGYSGTKRTRDPIGDKKPV